MFSSVLPDHKSMGTKNYNAVEYNDRKYLPLKNHFEYLKNLGEVRATRVVATLVDGYLSSVLQHVEERLQGPEGKSAGGGHL
jgi:hypothetical protein